MIELHGRERRVARALFEASPPGAHGSLAAGLSGEFGRLWVDHAKTPAVALLHLDFYFLAGDPRSSAAREVVTSLTRPIAVLAGPEWEPLLREHFGDTLETYQRTEFGQAPRDLERLTSFASALPAGYRLLRVGGADDVERLGAFDRDLVGNFHDATHFLSDGFGWAIEYDGEIVAGCSSFTRVGDLVEIEIDTHREHRRRGLALATGSALVLHCLEHDLQPCWDAANEDSARLAAKLGFRRPRRYSAWYARAPAVDDRATVR